MGYWRTVGVVGAAVLGCQYICSELLYQWRSRAKLRAASANVRALNEPARVLRGLKDLELQWDHSKKEDSLDTVVIIRFCLGPVIAVLQSKDCIQTFSRETIGCALKILTKCCEEATARTVVANLRGVDAVLKVFSELSRIEDKSPSIEALLEDAARAIAQITFVDPTEVVLTDDVPAGSEGATRLANSKNFGSFVGMLALDVGSTAYFIAFANCLKNISYLSVGAKRLREVNVLRHLYPLLDRQNHDLRDTCTAILLNLVEKVPECRLDLYSKPPGGLLKPFLVNPTQKSAKSAEAVLAVISTLLKKGTKQQKATIVADLDSCNMLEEISVIRTKSKELKQARANAEEVLSLAKEIPDFHDVVQAAESKYAREVAATIQREKLEARKANQRKQQFQMQMLLGGMGGMGGEMSEEDMLMAQLMGGMGGMGMGDEAMFGMEE